ncbi:MAG: DOMON domain-containing protein, partial [Candidatus Hodarchaeales archaeon]
GTFIIDAYSIGDYGPHPPDTELTGTNDILEFNGTEDNGLTIIEFKRLLKTGDEFDNSIPDNTTIPIIWALGSSDSFEVQHGFTKRGDGQLGISISTSTSIETTDFLSPGVLGGGLILSLSILLIFVDSYSRRHQKKRKSDHKE